MIESFRVLITWVILVLLLSDYNEPTCPVFFTIMLSLCLSPTPRTYVATQYPAQESVNRRAASDKLQKKQQNAQLKFRLVYNKSKGEKTFYASFVNTPTC